MKLFTFIAFGIFSIMVSILVEGKTTSISKIEASSAEIDTGFHSHTLWKELLEKYVDEKGNVDYRGFLKDKNKLRDYLLLMSKNPPTETWRENERLSYYINLYNAATVQLIVEHYPVESIKDIPNRWKKKWISVGTEKTSLNDIEHKILRKMDEPRIHFAINCASYSCPKLLNIPFTPENIERLLDKTAVDFINDKTRNRFQEKAEISKIFKWYQSDFTKEGTLITYINTFLENPLDKDTSIGFLDYDWSLNEIE